MALIHDDLNKIQNRTVDTSQVNSGASAVSESKTPIKIDFKTIAKNINIQEDVIVLIDSEDFKKLELNEQIKQLKEKFFPSISDNEKIKEYLNIVKEALQQAYNAPAKVESDKKTNDAKSSEVKTDEPETPVKENEKSSEKQSEIETLANDYIEKTNFSGDIDELRCELLQKAQTGEITEKEKILLGKLYENIPASDNEQKQPQMLLPLSVLLSENFLKKEPKEQLAIIEETYFKNDEEYNKLTSQKAKDNYIKKQMQNILKTLGINAKDPTKKDVLDVFTLLQTAKQGNIPLDTLKGKSKTELNNIIDTAQQKILGNVIEKITSQEGFKNLEKASDKALFTMKMVLTMTDENYKKIPADKKAEQDEYAQKKLDEFMAEYVPNWAGSTEENKEAFYQVALEMISGTLKSGNIEDLKAGNQAKLQYRWLTAIANNEKIEPNLKKICAAKADILANLIANGVENPTDKDIYEYLEKEAKNGTLTEDKKLLYEILKNQKKQGILSDEDNSMTSLEQSAANAGDKYKNKDGSINVKAFIEDQVSTILSRKDLSPRRKSAEIRKLYRQAGSAGEENIEYIEKIDELLRNAGYDDNAISRIKPRNLANKTAIGHGAKNEGAQASRAVRSSWQHGSAKEKEVAGNITQDMPGMLKDNEQRTEFGIGIYDTDELRSKYNEGLADRTQISKEDALETSKGILESDKVSDADKAKGAQEFITFSAQNGADEQLYFGKELSKIDNPAVLEGLGAASNSIQDPAKRTQYNNHIETAAKNYPPEVQKRVSKAIETGEVSPETKAKTDSYTTSTTSTKPASRPQQTQPAEATRPAQTPVSQAAPTVPTVPTVQTAPVKTPTVTPAAAQKANNDTTQALTDKRDRVAENILNYQEEVKRDLSARETQDIRETIAAISEGTIDENLENHMKKIIATNNVEIIYKAIANMGSDILQTFITTLTSYGSPAKILAFANVIKDDTAMLQSLYIKCTSESVRAKILKLMPSSVIYSMIASGQITNLSELDPSLLYEFLMQNMSTMSLNSISNYLKYLPFEDREKIVAILNGNDDEINPEIASNDELAQNLHTVQAAQKPEQDKTQQPQQDEVQPEIKANEMTAVRNDGTEIKRKSSFGAVSSTDFSESYEEVTNRTGLSRSAQDEVLTPGSPEWLRKYNKQQDVPPATAFTMAALEEDDELGMPFGSTKVGMGQKIRKKYPPQSFRFNA